MAKERIVYEKSFKENAVKLSYKRKSIAELSSELGISSHLIDRWRKKFESFGVRLRNVYLKKCSPINVKVSVSLSLGTILFASVRSLLQLVQRSTIKNSNP